MILFILFLHIKFGKRNENDFKEKKFEVSIFI